MKVALLAVSLLVTIASAAGAQETLEQKRDKKLQLPFLKKSAWTTDYDQALAESKKAKKAIFGYFTRSYSP